ncbi:MAG: hypothetical protein JO266_05355 [Acidobacteria bacterium]|nr:hypothetical protein [Acidobacteriota bacterium]
MDRWSVLVVRGFRETGFFKVSLPFLVAFLCDLDSFLQNGLDVLPRARFAKMILFGSATYFVGREDGIS